MDVLSGFWRCRRFAAAALLAIPAGVLAQDRSPLHLPPGQGARATPGSAVSGPRWGVVRPSSSRLVGLRAPDLRRRWSLESTPPVRGPCRAGLLLREGREPEIDRTDIRRLPSASRVIPATGSPASVGAAYVSPARISPALEARASISRGRPDVPLEIQPVGTSLTPGGPSFPPPCEAPARPPSKAWGRISLATWRG